MKRFIKAYDKSPLFDKFMYVLVIYLILYWTANMFVYLYIILHLHGTDVYEIIMSLAFIVGLSAILGTSLADSSVRYNSEEIKEELEKLKDANLKLKKNALKIELGMYRDIEDGLYSCQIIDNRLYLIDTHDNLIIVSNVTPEMEAAYEKDDWEYFERLFKEKLALGYKKY